MHCPPVQFSVAWPAPSQSLPPCLGAGAEHSRLRCLSHSGLQAVHSLHSPQLPSTAEYKAEHLSHCKFSLGAVIVQGMQASGRGRYPGHDSEHKPVFQTMRSFRACIGEEANPAKLWSLLLRRVLSKSFCVHPCLTVISYKKISLTFMQKCIILRQNRAQPTAPNI